MPLLFLYELLIRLSQPDSVYIVRISVDIWFKTIFSALGVNAISATFLVAAIIGAVILYVKREELPALNKKYFGFMLAESIFYALLVGLSIGIFIELMLNMNAGNALEQLSKFQLFALSLGAGLYEELFFRVILVSGLVFLFTTFFKSEKTTYILAVIIAALLFSAVHYVGQFGDIFTFKSFLFRFLFGLALNIIYVTRGFGIAAWTHALYDLFVIASL